MRCVLLRTSSFFEKSLLYQSYCVLYIDAIFKFVLMSENIEIIGAETHNLKNISVSIPKNTLTVITGVSGSGKSSLAFDTLYAEGQRRYLESLSTYARTIISDISEATHVREIRGLSPTIAIHQKTVSNNPRSTVGTITEIYDFYRLLFTSIGTPYCIHHEDIPLKKDSIRNIVEHVSKFSEGDRFHILTPIELDETILSVDLLSKKVTDMGFVRFQIGDTTYSVADPVEMTIHGDEKVYIVVDRLIKKDEENFETRLTDSLRIALEKGG